MKQQIDLYWSFRSPYCYLSMDRLFALSIAMDLTIRLRHVWPGAMRRPGYFARLHANYGDYHRKDSQRTAAFLKIPYGRPVPDPLVFDPETREPISEQPHIRKLTRLALAARQLGKEQTFLRDLMRLLWGGTVNGWDSGGHLASIAAGVGLDIGNLSHIARINAGDFDREVEKNGQLLEAAGHWGVPCMVLDGEPFFGQDRIEMLIWRLHQKGEAN